MKNDLVYSPPLSSDQIKWTNLFKDKDVLFLNLNSELWLPLESNYISM